MPINTVTPAKVADHFSTFRCILMLQEEGKTYVSSVTYSTVIFGDSAQPSFEWLCKRNARVFFRRLTQRLQAMVLLETIVVTGNLKPRNLRKHSCNRGGSSPI